MISLAENCRIVNVQHTPSTQLSVLMTSFAPADLYLYGCTERTTFAIGIGQGGTILKKNNSNQNMVSINAVSLTETRKSYIDSNSEKKKMVTVIYPYGGINVGMPKSTSWDERREESITRYKFPIA